MPVTAQLQSDLAVGFASFHGQLMHRACPLCGQDNAGAPALFASIPWHIRQCSACSMVYLENAPTYESLSGDSAAWQQSWREEKEKRARREPVLAAAQKVTHGVRDAIKPRDKLTALINRYIPRGDVLDVGCGVGHRAERFPAAVVPFGIEIEQAAAQRADALFAKRGGRAVFAPALAGLDAFDAQSFDGMVMYAYLEHEVEPAAVLRKAIARLRPGAPLIIKVPNHGCVNRSVRGLRWCGYRLPDHVNYFTPATLTRILADAGLKVLRFNFFDRMPTSDNMWLVARRPHSAA